jgi:hypothetical protein
LVTVTTLLPAGEIASEQTFVAAMNAQPRMLVVPTLSALTTPADVIEATLGADELNVVLTCVVKSMSRPSLK